MPSILSYTVARYSYISSLTFENAENLINSPGNSRLGSGYPIAAHENNVYIVSLAAAENSIYIVWTEGPNFEIAYRASILPFGVSSSLVDLTNNAGNSGSATIAVS